MKSEIEEHLEEIHAQVMKMMLPLNMMITKRKFSPTSMLRLAGELDAVSRRIEVFVEEYK